MMQQTFLVTLEIPAEVAAMLAELEAFRMADIIRDGFAAKSCSFIGPVPFTVKCQRVDRAALARGNMREYATEDFTDGEYRPVARLIEAG